MDVWVRLSELLLVAVTMLRGDVSATHYGKKVSIIMTKCQQLAALSALTNNSDNKGLLNSIYLGEKVCC